MPISPGAERKHRGRGASADELAVWNARAYPVPADVKKHAGANNRLPLDPVADELARRARRS